MENVKRVSVTVGDKVYLVYCIAKMGDILSIGKEGSSSKRNLFTLNAVMAVEQI